MPFMLHDHHIIPALAFIVLFAIWSNVLYFYSHGGGSSHHHMMGVQQTTNDEYLLMTKDLLTQQQMQPLKRQEDERAAQKVTPNMEGDASSTTERIIDSKGGILLPPSSYRSESNVFRQVLKRSQHFQTQCQTSLLPHHLGQIQPKDFDTGVPPLPEYGIQQALSEWLQQLEENNNAADSNDPEEETPPRKNNNDNDYPMCQLPPPKECDVHQFTIILMSHTVSDDERLSKLHRGIKTLSSWDITGEIILVWNNLQSVLNQCSKQQCSDLLSWDQDPHHKLRIFYALEQKHVKLENNLLNRYHPIIQPQNEAVVYFDDDGPFHSRLAMEVGFELWKRNSDVQIGSMARNIRFPSKRMDDLQNKASDLAATLYMDRNWRLGVHPYDDEEMRRWLDLGHETVVVEEAEEEEEEERDSNDTYQSHGYPKFTPICQNETGDVVEYNYFVFPNFKAHMSLPSGSILHRDFLCFVWHPVFEELRQYILKHPTHPDDMTISTLVSHLTGKALRTFPKTVRNNRKDGGGDQREKQQRRRLLQSGLRHEMVRKKSRNEHDDKVVEVEDDLDDENEFLGNDELQLLQSRRRRLLWQQKDWGNMREEAIGSIVGYFGSINPGSVGWCAGTHYQEKAEGKGNMRYNCFNEKPPDVSQIPWMNEGGIGYDEC
mmetsp:Transcript_3913/g.7524  ORF Transcript_3913/g.7524 Transcript_3913/m.7524 type:complete len:659 (+) Transcript_3913:249-2225(+)